MISLVLYLILAAILEFGRALFTAQVLQQAADVAAREISRTPLPAVGSLESQALNDPGVMARIFDERFLIVPLDEIPAGQRFVDYFADKPIVNQLLLPLMYVDRENGVLRYPGEFRPDACGRDRLHIPVVSYASGSEEIIRWVPVVEEIRPATASPCDPVTSPFSLTSSSPIGGGLVALRLNYPFQAATLSGFRNPPPTEDDPLPPNAGQPIEADAGPAGTYAGPEGLGRHYALGTTLRPFRRLLSAQAIYRREVYSDPTAPPGGIP